MRNGETRSVSVCKQPGMTQPAAAAVSINTKSSQEERGGYLRGFREREIVM